MSNRLSPAKTVMYILLCMVCTLGVRTLFAWRRLRRQMLAVPYVPPVTAAVLPAEEILVRGSGEPLIAQNEVLLRAAQKGSETPQEELLRVAEK
jgi:hypothetical protein